LVAEALALVDRRATVRETSFRQLYLDALGLDPFTDSLDRLRAPLSPFGIDPAELTRDDWLDLLMTHLIQPALPADGILVVFDYPASQCALAKVRPGPLPVAERFEVFLGPLELANGYHELTDGAEQRARFEADLVRRRQRGSVAPPLDEHLLASLANLPDCAGVALGVDRLMMAMLGTDRLADVIAFGFDRA
jgi:lysyl-tRNA synthetase class 2